MYGLIHAERGSIPVARACRVLRVSRSGYYQWLHAEPSGRSIDDAVLTAEIKEVFHEHKGRYGAPRVRRALRRRGARPSKKRVARLMRARAPRPYATSLPKDDRLAAHQAHRRQPARA